MALGMDGKLFTWGYRGRGLLGRTISPEEAKWAGMGMQVDGLGMLRVGLTAF